MGMHEIARAFLNALKKLQREHGIFEEIEQDPKKIRRLTSVGYSAVKILADQIQFRPRTWTAASQEDIEDLIKTAQEIIGIFPENGSARGWG